MHQIRNIRCASIAALAIGLFVSLNSTASARPSYAVQSCGDCHGSSGIGHTLTNQLLDVLSNQSSTIPPNQFGDPDRGEGPLPTYTATPGSSFHLQLQVKDPSDPPGFLPDAWGIALRRVYTTDPDRQAGNPDTSTWADNSLALIGSSFYDPSNPPSTPDPYPIPGDAGGWWRHLDQSGGVLNGSIYYASIPDAGHEWAGPLMMGLDVFVPGGVIPGWYDLEVSIQGWDYDFAAGPYAFYEEHHFYLNVMPEPTTALLSLAGLALVRRRRR